MVEGRIDDGWWERRWTYVFRSSRNDGNAFVFTIKRTLETLASDKLLRVDGSIGAVRCGMLQFFVVQ